MDKRQKRKTLQSEQDHECLTQAELTITGTSVYMINAKRNTRVHTDACKDRSLNSVIEYEANI